MHVTATSSTCSKRRVLALQPLNCTHSICVPAGIELRYGLSSRACSQTSCSSESVPALLEVAGSFFYGR